MSAHLQTLDGQPLTWERLHTANREFHATHDERGYPPRRTGIAPRAPLPTRSVVCQGDLHTFCRGRVGKGGTRACECQCHAVETED